ncbi:hypothetical protein HDU97_004455 [Phlyctochytrium planicorne]|nr:hypothetical protein HDU97_004455 [Phlyctochytrium planicorne]
MTLDPSRPNQSFDPKKDKRGTSSTTSTSGKKEYRYSGDLELRLPFESSPMDKPSTSFRDPTAWFKEAKEETEKRVEEEEKNRLQQEQAALRSPPQAMTADGSGKGARNSFFRNSFFGGGNANRKSTLGRKQHPLAGGGDGNDAVSPNALEEGLNDRSLGGDDRSRGANPHSKRPLGPRAFGTHNGGATINRASNGDSAYSTDLKMTLPHQYSSTTTLHRNSSEYIPIPPAYLQPRLYVYGGITLCSVIAFGLSVLNYTAPLILDSDKPSTGFFAFVSGSTALLSLVCIFGYLTFGKKLFAYYDAPFLFCQDVPITPSNGSNSSGPSSPTSVDSNGDGTLRNSKSFFASALTKLKRKDDSETDLHNQRSSVSTTNSTTHQRKAQRTSPSPYLPLVDLGLHTLLFLFWTSTVADLGAKVKTNPCNLTQAAAQSKCPDGVAFNRMLVSLAFGGTSAVAILVCVLVKMWQAHSFGILRSFFRRASYV